MIRIIKKDPLLVIVFTLAILSSFISLPKIEYIDFKVLILLFNLMIVIAGLTEIKYLDSIAINLINKTKNVKILYIVLTGITFLSSMFITNDVALITFVPLTLIIAKKIQINPIKIVIIQTVTANLGSSFTPMGNPQNLFIFNFYKLNLYEFLEITLPILLIGLLYILLLVINEKKNIINLNLEVVEISNEKHLVIFFILFLITLCSVFNIFDYRLSFIITLITVLIVNKRLLLKIDTSLLVIFISFFILIGNISNVDIVKNILSSLLNNPKSTYWYSIVASQFISNVPATMLLSPFTNNYQALLLGVNIGGLGTVIASLASVISYKLYINEPNSDKGLFMKSFLIINFIGLFLISNIIYFIIIN